MRKTDVGKYLSFVRRLTTPSCQLPFKLTFVVTKECHSRCAHCSIWRVKPRDELTLDEIRKFARNSTFLRWIDFTGGEPTDRGDFVDVVQAFLDACPDLTFVHFPTNGLKPDRIVDAAIRIASFRPPRLVVTVSIDGPEELNDKLRGIPGDFRRATETYKRLSDLDGITTFVGMTLSNSNSQYIEETINDLSKACRNFTRGKFHLNLAHSSSHYYETNNEPLSAITIGAWNTAIKKQRVPRTPFELLERVYQRKSMAYLSTGKTPMKCMSLRSSFYLGETGNVYPCTIWDAPIGNIRETGYSAVPLLMSQNADKLRADIASKNCPNCWTPCEAFPSILTIAK